MKVFIFINSLKALGSRFLFFDCGDDIGMGCQIWRGYFQSVRQGWRKGSLECRYGIICISKRNARVGLSQGSYTTRRSAERKCALRAKTERSSLRNEKFVTESIFKDLMIIFCKIKI